MMLSASFGGGVFFGSFFLLPFLSLLLLLLLLLGTRAAPAPGGQKVFLTVKFSYLEKKTRGGFRDHRGWNGGMVGGGDR